MKIRLTTASDIQELYELFKEAKVSRKDLTNERVPRSGFFEYNLSQEDIALRSENNRFSMIMENGGKIVSYILGYDKKFAKERVLSGEHIDPIVEKFVTYPGNLVYLDQLLLRKSLPVFLASRLMDTWESVLRSEKIEGVVTAIPQGEWTNEASLRFALYRGFSKNEIAYSGNVKLGIFLKNYTNLER